MRYVTEQAHRRRRGASSERTRRIPSRGPLRTLANPRGPLLGALPLVWSLLLLTASAGPGAASHPRPANALVTEIYQSGYTTEQSSFTVSMELSNTANVTFVYFNFCQLGNGVCFLPVPMSPAGSNWYVGTTHPMTSYHGMTPGVRAGYNITIQFANNSTVTEPTVPNPFSNLTVAQSVTGEYMFEMTVRNQTYTLGGKVTDSVTGAGIAGATVEISPGNNSTTTSSTGAYSFVGIPNGTYTLSVTDKGYKLDTETVAVAGTSAVRDFTLENATGPASSGQPGGGPGGLVSNPLVEAGLAISVVVVVAVALLAYARSRRRTKELQPPAPDSPGSPPSGPS